MKVRWIIITIMAVITTLFAFPNLTFAFNVRVVVSSENFSKTDILRSYITRELRTFEDVIVDDSDYAFEILVLGMDIKFGDNTSSKSAAFALGYRFRFDPTTSNQIFSSMVEEILNSKTLMEGSGPELLGSMLGESLLFESFQNTMSYSSFMNVAIWKLDNMKALAAEIVVHFDTAMLEPARQVAQKIENMGKELEDMGE